MNDILEFLQTYFVSQEDEGGNKLQKTLLVILFAMLILGIIGLATVFVFFPPSVERILQGEQSSNISALCVCTALVIAPILILRSMRISAADSTTDYSKEIISDDYIMIDEVARIFGITYRADEAKKLNYLNKTVVSGHMFKKPGTTWIVENCLSSEPVEMRSVAGVLMPVGDRRYYRFNARPIVPESLYSGCRSITINNYAIGATTTIRINERDNATLETIANQLEQMNKNSDEQISLLSRIVEKVNTEGSISSEDKRIAEKIFEASKDLLVNILGGAGVSLLEKIFLN